MLKKSLMGFGSSGSRLLRQHRLVSPALSLGVGLLLATAGVASAQTTDFNAEVKDQTQYTAGCPDGASVCGDAVVDGFGPAQYRFFLTSFEPKSESCGDYTATTTFTLQDGSRLTLDEVGVACGTGKSFFKGGERAYGSPRYRSGSWQVQAATGQFAGMTGSGTTTAHFAGAHVRATYSGTLNG